MKMASGFFKDGLFDLAVKELEQYGKEEVAEKEVCPYNLTLGMSYHELKRFGDAIAPLTVVLKERCALDAQESAYFYLGNSYLQNGEREEAKANFERLKYLYPESAFIKRADEKLGHIIFTESLNQFDERQYKRAIRGFEMIQNLKGAKVPLDELQTKIGDSYYYLENYAKAGKAYEKALELVSPGEKQGRIRFQLASIRYHQGDYKKAISKMESFLNEFADHSLNVQAKNTILWAHYRKGDFKKAYNHLETFQNSESNVADREAKNLIGSASRFIVLGEYGEAVRLLEEALKRYGEDPLKGEMMTFLARSYHGNGREVLEEETYREVVKRYPRSPFARKSLFELGQISFKKGLYKEAAGHFTAFAERDPLGTTSDNALFYLAESLFHTGEHETAREHFLDLINNYKDSDYYWRAALRVADIDAMSGRYSRAAEEYRHVMKNLSKAAQEDVLWKMAEAFRKGDESKSALKAYNRYLKKYPKGPKAGEAGAVIVDMNYRAGDYKKGVKRFAGLFKKGKGDELTPENLITLARGYIKIGDMESAAATLDNLIKKYPKNEMAATAYYLKGWVSQKQSKLKEANKDYLRLLKKFPHTPLREEVHWQIAGNYFVLEDYKKALKSFKVFSVAFPESHRDSEGMLRKSYAALGDFKGALEGSSTFFDVSPDKAVDLKQRCNEAIALFEVGSYDEAVKLAERIIDQFPTNSCSARVMVMAGEAHLKLGNAEKAEEHFMRGEEQLRADPLKSLAAFRLGEIALKAGDYRESLMALEKITPYQKGENENLQLLKIFIDPAYMMAMNYYYRGEAYLNLNLIEESLANFRRLIDDFGDLKMVQQERLRAGLVSQQNKDYDEAIKAMTQIIALSDDTRMKAEAQYWIGECYQHSGDTERAIVEYLKVTYLYPAEWMWALTARYMAAEAYQQTGAYENAIKLYQIVAKESNDKRKSEYAKKKVEELTGKLAARAEPKKAEAP